MALDELMSDAESLSGGASNPLQQYTAQVQKDHELNKSINQQNQEILRAQREADQTDELQNLMNAPMDMQKYYSQGYTPTDAFAQSQKDTATAAQQIQANYKVASLDDLIAGKQQDVQADQQHQARLQQLQGLANTGLSGMKGVPPRTDLRYNLVVDPATGQASMQPRYDLKEVDIRSQEIADATGIPADVVKDQLKHEQNAAILGQSKLEDLFYKRDRRQRLGQEHVAKMLEHDQNYEYQLEAHDKAKYNDTLGMIKKSMSLPSQIAEQLKQVPGSPDYADAAIEMGQRIREGIQNIANNKALKANKKAASKYLLDHVLSGPAADDFAQNGYTGKDVQAYIKHIQSTPDYQEMTSFSPNQYVDDLSKLMDMSDVGGLDTMLGR